MKTTPRVSSRLKCIETNDLKFDIWFTYTHVKKWCNRWNFTSIFLGKCITRGRLTFKETVNCIERMWALRTNEIMWSNLKYINSNNICLVQCSTKYGNMDITSYNGKPCQPLNKQMRTKTSSSSKSLLTVTLHIRFKAVR